MSKTFFRRNTDVFQGKMVQRSVKRPAVRVRWELEEYTLDRPQTISNVSLRYSANTVTERISPGSNAVCNGSQSSI